MELLMVRQVLLRDLGPVIIISNLSQFSLRKLAGLHP